MSQRIDIFISSTSRDLPEHRKQVMDACLEDGWTGPIWREYFLLVTTTGFLVDHFHDLLTGK